ncbi:EAL domain-containing protein [Rhizobiales bacterium RZME27]|uniref:EAL domain-containing protein n=1 Tax=Endobacterium cereale TaxID=2663029 RepID=A0A6A8A2A4_9HYPH|nr:EAL domain-containing protein [Endobacterium cereale]
MFVHVSALQRGGSLREGDKVSFEIGQDQRTGKSKAESVSVIRGTCGLRPVQRVDGFKPVNDVHGHKAGDELLSQLASRLARTSHGRALVARLGGDEFAFLLQTADPAAPKKLAEEICGVCREPFVIADAMIEVGASIGFASSALSHEEMTRLYDQADFALYQAKRNAPGTALAFSPEHHHSLSRLTVIEHAFRDGSVNQHISLAFQPIFDVANNTVTAFEALARWHHPVLGPVSPAEFIPVAERLGHIKQLTRTLLSMALQEARFWPHHIRLSFNLSARDLSSSDHAMRLLALIANSGIEPSRIDLEITETAINRSRTCSGDCRCLPICRYRNILGRFRHWLFKPDASPFHAAHEDQDRQEFRDKHRR